MPPILEPLEGVLPEGLKYVESETTSPPERGVKVVKILDPENENECLTPFTSLIIGVKTNEYANCRWDYEDKGSYSEYAESFTQGSAMTINHTFYLPSSATASEEALENVGIAIEGGRNYAFFIKCVDRNGNENPLPFMIEFCVEEGPDLRPPKILGTSLDGAYIRYNATSPIQMSQQRASGIFRTGITRTWLTTFPIARRIWKIIFKEPSHMVVMEP